MTPLFENRILTLAMARAEREKTKPEAAPRNAAKPKRGEPSAQPAQPRTRQISQPGYWPSYHPLAIAARWVT